MTYPKCSCVYCIHKPTCKAYDDMNRLFDKHIHINTDQTRNRSTVSNTTHIINTLAQSCTRFEIEKKCPK